MIEIRKIAVSDFAVIERIYFPYSGRHLNVARLTDAIDDYPSAVALSDGEIVGFAYCFRFAPDIIELANIFVLRPFRSDGLGARILDFIKAELRAEQAAIIAVNSDLYSTSETKRRPDRFYRDNGFEILRSTVNSTIYWWQRGA